MNTQSQSRVIALPQNQPSKPSGRFSSSLTNFLKLSVLLAIAIFQSLLALAQSPPSIITQPQSAVVVLSGSNLTVSVNATGSPVPSFQWRFDGTNMDGQVLSSLSFTNITEDQSGSYDVVVTNSYGSVTSCVSRITVMTPTIYWTGAGDGQSWNNSSNWNTGVLPTSSDSIFISNTNGTITVSSGMTLSNLLCQCSLTLNGSLNVEGAVDITQSFSLPVGNSISVNGTNAALIAEGSTTADGVSMYAGSGSLISFPGLTNINNPSGSPTIYLTAYSDAVLDLSSVRQMAAVNYEGAIEVNPQAGGFVNLGGLTNIPSGEILFYADYTNSEINLNNLQTFSGADCDLDAANGGAIWATNLNSISGVTLSLNYSSTLALSNLNFIYGGDGNIQYPNESINITAYPGAVLDLSSVRYMQGTTSGGLNLDVTAYTGATVNLSGLTNTVSDSGGVNFYADYTNSEINLNNLQTFSSADSVIEAANGGVILATRLQSISGGGTSFLANGVGSLIDLSSLSAFTTPLSTSSLTAENGGVILLNCNVLLLQNVAVNWAGCALLPPVIPASGLLSLYAQPWNSYWVETLDTRNATNQWQFYERIPATNDLQVISGSFPSWLAFQVYEFVADPPILDLNRISRTNVQFVLYGAPPNNFGVQTTDSLDTQPIDWSLLETTCAMTNSFRIFAPFAPTDAMRFYRAQEE